LLSFFRILHEWRAADEQAVRSSEEDQ